MSRLQNHDIPRRLPSQIAQLGDGRLLVRGPSGLALLGGADLGTAETILDRVDGRRTVDEICAVLAPQLEAERIVRLLKSFDGVLLSCDFRPPITPSREKGAPKDAGLIPSKDQPGTLLVLGNGDAAHCVAELLAAPCFEALDDGQWLEAQGDSALLICALEDTPYNTLFEVQQACLRASALSLFVIADPDGVRIGPLTVPESGPCIACAQIASLRRSGLSPHELLAATSSFRTGVLTGPVLEPAIRQTVTEAHAAIAFQASDRSPQLLTAVGLLGVDGRRSQYSVTPVAGCEVCQAGEDGKSATTPAHSKLSSTVQRELVATARRAPRRAAPPASDNLVHRIGIVGGGTAGYLTAMALRRKLPHLDVTLIESSSLPIIGVGEATTPLMPQFLHVDLGLDIVEFFRQVEPTLKLGIRFEWGTPEGFFNYPFGPVHVLEPAVYDDDLLRCSPQSMLMAAGAVALEQPDDGPSTSHLGVDVAYHLDNQPFVRYLRSKAAGFGVTTLDARIVDVDVSADGDSVTGLVTDDGLRLEFDLYVDCSGFRSLLIEKALRSPLLSYEASLFADRALIASVPNQGVVQPYTRAETLTAGWCWSTPQRREDHRGYVFSSAFLSPEEAEREMRRSNPEMGEARLIPFHTGRHEHFWRSNVVAMGNAYGFVEPLESTALHMLIRQIGLLLSAFPLRRDERGITTLLSRKVGAYWDYLSWFLAIHYRFNRRLDTPFWRHCRHHVDISHHAELVDAFRERGPLSYNAALLRSFNAPDPLWGAEGIDVLLMGQRVATNLPSPRLDRAAWQQRARLFEQATQAMSLQAPALELLDCEPELLRRWAGVFERFGPAFPK